MRSTSNLANQFDLYSTDIMSLMDEFAKSPHSNIFFKNKKGLINSAKEVTFSKQKWNRNPMQFCSDHYGKQYYYPAILVVNSIGSVYQFTQSNLSNVIIAPLQSMIISLLSFETEE